MDITGGYGIRNLFRSDAFKILKAEKDMRIVIFTPFTKGRSFIADLPEVKGENIILEDLAQYKPNLIERFLRKMAELVLFNINYISTVWLKDQILKKHNRPRYLLTKFVKKILGKDKNLIEACWRFDMILSKYKMKRYKKPFRKYQPSVVFVTDFLHPYEWGVAKTARQLRIPVVSMIANWDHLTKNVFQKSDKVIAWDEFNKKQLIDYYGYDSKDILVAGIPHQDYFVQAKDKFLSKKEFLRKIGAPDDKKLITYTTARGSKDEPDIIDIICNAIKEGKIKSPAHVHVRTHPEDDPNRYEKLKKYEGIITFELPKKTVGERFWSGKMIGARPVELGKIWVPDDEEMIHYSNLIAVTDVAVNVASSVTLDAVALDTPVINIAFDGYAKRDFVDSNARVFKLTNYEFVPQSGGVRIAYSADDLINFINMYLENPKLDQEGRKKLVAEHCGTQDGKAGERIGKFILDYLKTVEKKEKQRLH